MHHLPCDGTELERAVRLPEFWVELGSASPAVLQRMGCALCACSALDCDVSDAISRAAGRLRERDRGHERQDSAVAPAAGKTRRARGLRLVNSVTEGPCDAMCNDAVPFLMELVGEDSDASSEAGSSGDDSNATPSPVGEDFATMLPHANVWALMPGYGGRLSFVAWMFLVVVSLTTEVYTALVTVLDPPRVPKIKLRDSRMSRLGDVCLEASHVATFIMCIQILRGLERFVHSRGLLEALAREREVGGWQKLARFSSRVSCIAWALFALLSWNTVFVNFTLSSFFDPRGWFHDNYGTEPADILASVLDALAWQVFNMLIVSVFVVFGVMWKLTMLDLLRVCDEMRQGGGDIRWSSLTHEYIHVCSRMERLWGGGGMAPTLAAALASLILTSLFAFVLGTMGDDVSLVAYNFMWGTLSGGLVVGAILLMAELPSKCTSRRWSRNSILNLAVRESARVPLEQRLQHMVFKDCVLRNPTSVDLGVLGLVTRPAAMALFRVFIVAVPSVATLVAARTQGI
mmetsp:Transcript_36755/g.104617  ORF Transcript_36755/g.104617 Transcript_36755/m.104617 type:complete len:517 (+) Transcript_36755:58-1608(+)